MRILKNIAKLTAGEEPILRLASKIAKVRNFSVEKVSEILGKKINMEDLVEYFSNVI